MVMRMKTNDDLNLDPESYPHANPPGAYGLTRLPARPGPANPPQNESPPDGRLRDSQAPSPQIDPWPIAEAVVKRWYLLVLGGIAFGILAVLAGGVLWKTAYTATAQLIRNDSPALAEVWRDRETPMQTFADLLRTPELLQRVGAAADPIMTVEDLASTVVITPERNKESLNIAVTAASPELAVDLANLYAREAVRFTKELQSKDAATLNEHLKSQLTTIDGQIHQLEEQVRQSAWQSLQTDQQARLAEQLRQPALEASQPVPLEGATPVDALSTVTRSILVDQLRTAQLELANLLSQYTEASPLVKAQRMKLARLEVQFEDSLAALPAIGVTNKPAEAKAAGSDNASSKTELASSTNLLPAGVAPRTMDLDVARSRLASFEAVRLPLAGRQRLFQNLVDNPPGQLQVLIPARSQSVARHGREIKMASLGVFGALVGIIAMVALVLLFEAMGRRLKTDDDVRRVTRLPVIASLGNLRRMSQAARERWAFQTWTALQAKLSSPSSRGLVCGIISSSDGEGRSTLIQLFARAASQHGYRVLTISASPNGSLGNGSRNELGVSSDSATVTANVLASPGDVAHRLVGPNPQVVVNISLPDWSWSVERRKQLEAALDHWRTIDNVVILVNLPPASEPQSILLAEELTNLIWITDSGRADAAATRTQVETLRQGRCRLVGAVLNHAPSHPLKSLFPRWVAA